MWGKFTDDKSLSVLFCSVINTLLSNDLDTEDHNILVYNMEGFLAFRDFEAYAYVS